jgi:hypothetical protein
MFDKMSRTVGGGLSHDQQAHRMIKGMLSCLF